MVGDGSDSLLPITVGALHIILLLPFFLFMLVMLSLLRILVSHQLLSLVAFSGFLSAMFLGPLPPSLSVFQPSLCLLSSHLLSLFIHHILSIYFVLFIFCFFPPFSLTRETKSAVFPLPLCKIWSNLNKCLKLRKCFPDICRTNICFCELHITSVSCSC